MQLTKQIDLVTHLTHWRGLFNKNSENNSYTGLALFLTIRRKFNQGSNGDVLQVFCNKDT